MWVIGQDKAMTNLDRIIYIYIEENTFGEFVIEAYFGSEDTDYVWLGEYKTDLRAQGVLDMIMEGLTSGRKYLELPEE